MKALVAEDDLYTLEALKAILEGEGWTVTACADGAAAAQAFKPGAFDLVCLDVMMGGLSGYDVCRAVRRVDRRVPVLFISAKSEEIDKVLGLELGADDFVVKPFGVREVLARVHALVRRSSRDDRDDSGTTPEDRPFAFGPWRILPLELRAQRDEDAGAADQRVDLLPRELAMLRLLVSRPGQAVSRAQFFRSCWDLENPPLSRTLDQHIVQLRKKLEAPGARPRLIRTVQGVGYRHDPE